jgi:segregation and condensation protein A
MDSFSIQTDVFAGPLELLLDLIEKRKLLINDISLAAVTDDFMAYTATLTEDHLEQTSHFVLIASTLLLIKSKSLLPVLDLTDEEEASIEDLETRLKLYKIYREASVALRTSFGARVLYKRPFERITTPLFIPDAYTTPATIREAMSAVLLNLPKKILPRVAVAIRKVISLEDMMKRLEERITQQFKISFSKFAESGERGEVIVSFLAVLELIKQGMIMVRQEARFADFDIEHETVDTPRYL